jgi:aldehyde dehydrogenase (NAD+)
MNVVTAIAPVQGQTESSIASVFAAQKQKAIALRTSSAAERIAKLKRLETALLARKDAIYAAVKADLGKPAPEADLTELMPVLSEIRHTAKHLKGWMRTKSVAPTMALLGTQARIRYEPKGVSLIISPWNYPINLTLGPLASAIGAGCTAILKPSEMTPNCSAVLAELVAAVFAPDEVALFEGDAGVSTELLALPFDHIFFTGSPAVGKIVMAAAAKNLTSVTLELGGKSPVIVDETADVKKAASSIMWGKFLNVGQTCIAPDYLYVHEQVMPAFLEAAKAAIAKMYGADAAKSADYCRIVNERHFGRVKRILDDATAKGANVVLGGAANVADRFMAPTLLTNVSRDSLVMQEEIFGPVLPILAFTDLADVIAHINADPKPLALYVFSKDNAAIERVLSQTSAGGSCVNMTVLHFSHANLPFGGVNNSGIGSSHGLFGFKAFSHERAVLREQMSAAAMLAPPYTAKVKTLIGLTMKYFT